MTPCFIYPQVTLEADGPGNTYELINSVLAPDGNVVENPECVHPEFGRHITEVWDADLNQYVFEFYIHVTPDNDRCINFDRQRMEIKTYGGSPDNLKGVVGERIEYHWKFRLPEGFQPSTSFTHIHQIKAVGGDDGMPIFTLTPRKASPNRMELKHDNTTNVVTVPLSLFEGVWVACTEILTVGVNGSYSMEIRKVSDGTVLLSYSNDNIMTIRADNDFIRPKWGLYRSLDHPDHLRDEAMRFAGFSIEELAADIRETEPVTPDKVSLLQNYPNPFNPSTNISFMLPEQSQVSLRIVDISGKDVQFLLDGEASAGHHQVQWDGLTHSGSLAPSGPYFVLLQAQGHSYSRKLLLLK